MHAHVIERAMQSLFGVQADLVRQRPAARSGVGYARKASPTSLSRQMAVCQLGCCALIERRLHLNERSHCCSPPYRDPAICLPTTLDGAPGCTVMVPPSSVNRVLFCCKLCGIPRSVNRRASSSWTAAPSCARSISARPSITSSSICNSRCGCIIAIPLSLCSSTSFRACYTLRERHLGCDPCRRPRPRHTPGTPRSWQCCGCCRLPR